MKKTFFSIALIMYALFMFSINNTPVDIEDKGKDTIRTLNLDEFVITSSVKETNALMSMPTAISIVSPKMLVNRQVESLSSLSGLVPNFFVPNYGSKVSTPIYIRGVGARLGAQTVSLYVDNVPYFNPSAFDFEFQYIQRIEILRGAQGTLYGRNAIGGIVNIYTLSPLTYQGSSVSLGGGSYGEREARISNYSKFNDKIGTSIAAYYKENDGYFVNNYTGQTADEYKNLGAHFKFEWEVNDAFKASLFSTYDYVSQGAFPYMHQDSTAVNFNEPSSYERRLFSQGLSLNYQGNGFVVNSTTGYQYLKDDMRMDQDYSPLSIFSIQQEQNQHSLSQEITFKSDRKQRYSWVIGAFGFYDYRKVTTPVSIKKDGMNLLQNQLDKMMSQMPPQIPFNFKYANTQIDLPGIYRKPSKGLALFEQSSMNGLFGAAGLTLTFGIRLDYEHTSIDYFTETQGVKVDLVPKQARPGMPAMFVESDTLMQGNFSKDFWEVLPKIALQYDLTDNAFVYLSASKGYKTGGYNEQSFSKLLQDAMQTALRKKIMSRMPGGAMPGSIPPNSKDKTAEPTLEQQLSFDPEVSWSYELGGRMSFLNKKLSTTFALFAIDVDNIQIIHLLDQGQAGRTVSNAGKSTSKGLELSIAYAPSNSFSFFTEYGFVNAEFKNYKSIDKEGKSIDYTGNKIPFAPRNTLSLGGSFRHSFINSSIIDSFMASVQYTAAGKIYWTDSNNASQPFYGLANATVMVEKGSFGLELWGKNILDTSYNAFYFEAANLTGQVNSFVQHGNPLRVGATLKYTIDY
ncbi:MAG: TonB-dependent receptor [Candidatus Saccharimonadaceae bacterium]